MHHVNWHWISSKGTSLSHKAWRACWHRRHEGGCIKLFDRLSQFSFAVCKWTAVLIGAVFTYTSNKLIIMECLKMLHTLIEKLALNSLKVCITTDISACLKLRWELLELRGSRLPKRMRLRLQLIDSPTSHASRLILVLKTPFKAGPCLICAWHCWCWLLVLNLSLREFYLVFRYRLYNLI